jgi:hypothetical protein
MKTIETKNFYIQVDTDNKHGYFEHHEEGDEYAVELWFEDGELEDFDGVYSLPKEVAVALNELGLKVDIDLFCE